MVEALSEVPPYEVDPSYYSDWGDPREYSIGDMGVGECAGEVVPYAIMGLAASEREVFEAQVLLDQKELVEASRRARSAMTNAARSLVRELAPNVGDDPDEVAREFKARLVEPKIFFDPFAGGKFAHYFLRALAEAGATATEESTHQLIEEAQLFIDASHQCYEKLRGAASAS